MRIEIDYKLDNWNDTININRRNRYAGASKKRKEMDIVKGFLNKENVIKEYPIRLKCKWHVKNMNSDLDNKSLKAVLDCMQEIGILENDNIKHIPEIEYKAIKDKEDYLEIEIEAIKKEQE